MTDQSLLDCHDNLFPPSLPSVPFPPTPWAGSLRTQIGRAAPPPELPGCHTQGSLDSAAVGIGQFQTLSFWRSSFFFCGQIFFFSCEGFSSGWEFFHSVGYLFTPQEFFFFIWKSFFTSTAILNILVSSFYKKNGFSWKQTASFVCVGEWVLVILWGCTVKLLTMITVKLVIILDLLCTGFYLEHPNLLPCSIFTQRPVNDQKIETSSQCCTDYIEPNNQCCSVTCYC